MCSVHHPAHPDWAPCVSGIENHPMHQFFGPNGEQAMLQNDEYIDIHQATRSERNEKLQGAKSAVRDRRNEQRAERRRMSDQGRVDHRHPESSEEAAEKVDARSQRAKAMEILNGATDPITHSMLGHLTGIAANQMATRMQECWEGGRAAVARERGHCVFGVCHVHEPEKGPDFVHTPHKKCDKHGKEIQAPTPKGGHGGGWISLERERPAQSAPPAPEPAPQPARVLRAL